MNIIFNTPEINTVNRSTKRGFPFDQPADCWFPTWDPFECVCLCRDSQRPESHTSRTFKEVVDSKYRTVPNRRDATLAGWITWGSGVCKSMHLHIPWADLSVPMTCPPSLLPHMQPFPLRLLPFPGRCNHTRADQPQNVHVRWLLWVHLHDDYDWAVICSTKTDLIKCNNWV